MNSRDRTPLPKIFSMRLKNYNDFLEKVFDLKNNYNDIITVLKLAEYLNLTDRQLSGTRNWVNWKVVKAQL